MFQVEVRSRIVGSKTDDSPPAVTLDLLNETLTVAQLIEATVEEQIRDLQVTRKLDAERAAQVLNRQYMTHEEIDQAAQSGSIRLPNLKTPKPRAIDTASEIEKAKRAFTRKTVLIVVDSDQPEHLTDTITLTSTSKVTFVRLTPLVGG